MVETIADEVEEKRRFSAGRFIAFTAFAAVAAFGTLVVWEQLQKPAARKKARALGTAARRAWEHPERVAVSPKKHLARFAVETLVSSFAKTMATKLAAGIVREAMKPRVTAEVELETDVADVPVAAPTIH